ncbi:hypothetical protein ACHAWF_014232 [Thalassiosira exigua]
MTALTPHSPSTPGAAAAGAGPQISTNGEHNLAATAARTDLSREMHRRTAGAGAGALSTVARPPRSTRSSKSKRSIRGRRFLLTPLVVAASSLSLSVANSSEVVDVVRIRGGGDDTLSEHSMTVDILDDPHAGHKNAVATLNEAEEDDDDVEEEESYQFINHDGVAPSPQCAEVPCTASFDEDKELSEPFTVEQYYFAQEIDFFAKQAMILGDHPDASREDDLEGVIARLWFIEKSLQMELDYIRRLKMLRESGTLEQFDNETHSIQPEIIVPIEGGEGSTNAADAVIDAVKGATWPTWVGNGYDYDWIVEREFFTLYAKLKCKSQTYNQNKPMYTPEMWNLLWEAYRESTLFPFPVPEAGDSSKLYYAKHTSDGKGRGNFASEDIPAGSLVHSGHPNTVFFLDNKSWYRFVTLLPKMFACDVMEWAWMQDLTDTGNVVLCLNLDEAVFFNDGGGDGKLNMELLDSASMDFHATRDIKKDEELLYDYEHFGFDQREMNL